MPGAENGDAGGRWWSTLAAGAIAGAVYAIIAAASYAPGTFLIGDCPYYATAAVSIWFDGDLEVRNNLSGDAHRHAGFVSVGPAGEWRPKHPLLMPVASVPFLALFGVPGLLIFNVVVLGALAAAVHRLALRGAGTAAATAAALVTCLISFVPAYAYNYSPDAFAALPAIASLALLLGGRPAGAGVLAGLAFLAKPVHALVALAGVTAVLAREGRGAALRFAAGLLPSLAAFALVNLLLFGGPLTTGYDRMLAPDSPTGVVSQRGDFQLAAVPANLVAQIVDPRHGLLRTAPAALLALLGLPALWRRNRAAALLTGGLFAIYWLFFSSFLDWSASHYGNRYLLVPVLASALPLAALLDRLRSVARRGPRAAAASR